MAVEFYICKYVFEVVVNVLVDLDVNIVMYQQ